MDQDFVLAFRDGTETVPYDLVDTSSVLRHLLHDSAAGGAISVSPLERESFQCWLAHRCDVSAPAKSNKFLIKVITVRYPLSDTLLLYKHVHRCD